jgi:peptidoglycan/LPS O-acetylase OafA/YrhL
LIGVQLFFVISGYIITQLLLSEEEKRGQISIRAFYIRRAFRILPPLWCYFLGLGLLSWMGVISVSGSALASSAAFTCNTGYTNCSWFVAHTWSLAVEEQYYLAWPLLFSLVPKDWRSRFLCAIIAALVLCLLLLPDHPIRNEINFASIAIGALFATSSQLRTIVAKLANMGLFVLSIGALLLGWLYPQTKPLIVLTPALALCVIFSARELPVKSFIESGVLNAVGLCSYSLYLWQQIFLAPPTSYPMTLPLAALPVVVGLSYFLSEKPLQLIGHRLSARVKSQPSGYQPSQSRAG